jgi:hypothetical protein
MLIIRGWRILDNKKSQYIVFGSIFFICMALTVTTGSSGYASSDAYDSGYDHGCDDSGISDPDDRYYNQPGKGPSFHTDAFNRGYDDGFNACSSSSSDNGGGSDDRDERAGSTEILSNAQDCYDAAYRDGQDFPFDEGANDFCRQFTDDQGNPYYTGFIDGCMSIQGNTLDICESATD